MLFLHFAFLATCYLFVPTPSGPAVPPLVSSRHLSRATSHGEEEEDDEISAPAGPRGPHRSARTAQVRWRTICSTANSVRSTDASTSVRASRRGMMRARARALYGSRRSLTTTASASI